MAAVVVYAPSTRGFFTPDDLVYLERTRHLVPPQPLAFWRFLSGPAYFALGVRWFGGDPRPWMTVNVGLHALNAVLVYACARRWGGGPLAAIIASVLFGASRLWLTAVQQVVTIGDLGALTFSLLAMLAATAGGRAARRAAIPLFGAALLFKETVLLLPLLLVWPGFDRTPLRERATRVAGLMAPAAFLVLYLIVARAGTRTFGGEAYASGIGPHLFDNLMTLTAWGVDLRSVVPDLVTIRSPTAWHVGLPVLIVVAGAAIACWARTRLSAIGLAWWLLALVPVLPLLHHTYLFYLYAPFAGFAIAVGAACEVGTQAVSQRSIPESRRQLVVVIASLTAVVLMSYTALSVLKLRERHPVRIQNADIPFDPFLRKSELARRIAEPFHDAAQHGTVRAVFVLPKEGFWTFASSTGARAMPGSNNPQYTVLPTVLHQGLALRALNPSVDSVAFVDRWTPAYRDFDLFTSTPDGRAMSFGRGPDAHARFGLVLLNARLDDTARDHLQQAMAVWPADSRLAFEHAIALEHLGDVEGERVELTALLTRDSLGPVAEPARARLAALGPAPAAKRPR